MRQRTGRRDGGEVALEQFVPEHVHVRVRVERVIREAEHVDRGTDRVDRGRDGDVGRRDDLRGPLDVDLVAVVGRRVVAGGDDDARGGIERLLRECTDRGRLVGEEAVHVHAGAGDDGSHIAGEALRVVPGVERDDDAALRGGRIGREQVVDEPTRRTDHDGAVHPIRTRTDTAAQPGGPERQPAPDELGEHLCVGGVGESGQLGTHHGVGVTIGPGVRTLAQCVEVHGAPLPSAGRAPGLAVDATPTGRSSGRRSGRQGCGVRACAAARPPSGRGRGRTRRTPRGRQDAPGRCAPARSARW